MYVRTYYTYTYVNYTVHVDGRHVEGLVQMDVDLEAVLAARKAQYKSTVVEKEVELQYDLGNLLATDLNPLDAQALKYVL